MNEFLKDKPAINKWLRKQDIRECELVPDDIFSFVVNVNGDVDISEKKLKIIPVKFNHVTGHFICSYNKLTSLEFSPTQVGGHFSCNDNLLTSLKGCPSIIGQVFDCENNDIQNLEFFPQSVNSVVKSLINKIMRDDECRFANNSQLGEIQNITSFKKLFEIHKHTIIEKHYNNLDKSLGETKTNKHLKI